MHASPVLLMIANCTINPLAHAALLASARQRPENQKWKPGRPLVGARSGGPAGQHAPGSALHTGPGLLGWHSRAGPHRAALVAHLYFCACHGRPYTVHDVVHIRRAPVHRPPCAAEGPSSAAARPRDLTCIRPREVATHASCMHAPSMHTQETPPHPRSQPAPDPPASVQFSPSFCSPRSAAHAAAVLNHASFVFSDRSSFSSNSLICVCIVCICNERSSTARARERTCPTTSSFSVRSAGSSVQISRQFELLGSSAARARARARGSSLVTVASAVGGCESVSDETGSSTSKSSSISCSAICSSHPADGCASPSLPTLQRLKHDLTNSAKSINILCFSVAASSSSRVAVCT